MTRKQKNFRKKINKISLIGAIVIVLLMIPSVVYAGIHTTNITVLIATGLLILTTIFMFIGINTARSLEQYKIDILRKKHFMYMLRGLIALENDELDKLKHINEKCMEMGVDKIFMRGLYYGANFKTDSGFISRYKEYYINELTK